MNPSSPNRRAVIDIGTNSVKLLVGDVAGNLLTPIIETSKQTRLGAGFYATKKLQAPAIAATAEVVKTYSEEARKLGAKSLRVIATSAARDASNAADLIAAIRKSSGVELEVISGDKEADWAFRGVTSNPKLAKSPVLIVDVGGGSTEFVVGDNAVPQFRDSYNLGTVRLLEQLRPGDPPGLRALITCRVTLKEFLKGQIVPLVRPALTACKRPVQLVGVGGSATLLSRIHGHFEDYDREKIESNPIPLEVVREQLELQWQMPLIERQKIAGLPADKADVILTGIAIYEAIMEQLGFTHLTVSTRGLRYWALLRQ